MMKGCALAVGEQDETLSVGKVILTDERDRGRGGSAGDHAELGPTHDGLEGLGAQGHAYACSAVHAQSWDGHIS